MNGELVRNFRSLRSGGILCALLGAAPLAAAPGDEFWDAGFGVPGVEGYGVGALAAHGSELFIGGTFLSVGGVAATNLACWNGREWSQVGGGIGRGLSEGVRGLLVDGDQVYVSGTFTNAGTTPALSVVRWDGKQWAALDSGIQGVVMPLATDGSSIFVGGSFTRAGGIAATNVARWDGERWWAVGGGVTGTELGPGFFGAVYAMAAGADGIYVAGYITNAGGIKVNNIARWDGTNWFAVGEGIPHPIRALAVSGTEVYAGGGHYRQGESAVYVNKWDGARWQPILMGPWPGAGGAVTLLVSGKDIYVGGGLVFPGGFPIPGVAKWDGTQWQSLGSALNMGAVHALAASGAELFVGGEFTIVGGKPATNIALWRIPHVLEIQRSGDQVTLSWPATGSNLVLEASRSVPATNWIAVPVPPAVVQDQLVVTNRAAEPSRFYRLRRK